jgi:hypothetical protein
MKLKGGDELEKDPAASLRPLVSPLSRFSQGEYLERGSASAKLRASATRPREASHASILVFRECSAGTVIFDEKGAVTRFQRDKTISRKVRTRLKVP